MDCWLGKLQMNREDIKLKVCEVALKGLQKRVKQ
jgi:hypothetical protein